MKKLFFFLAFSLVANILSAQVEMRWDSHGVGFTVPSDFKVVKSTGDEYTAQNNDLFLSISPFQNENVDKSHLAEALLQIAKELEYDTIEEVDEIDIDDFEGYYVKGTKDGVNALLLCLLDTESSTNLFVAIVYDDTYFDEAMGIAGSFFAYDK